MKSLFRSLREHRLVRNAGALVIVQAFTYITPLVSLIYLNRVIGIGLYGVVAYSFALVQFAAVLLDFGFTLSATQRISQRRNQTQSVGRFLGSIFTLKAIGYLLVSAGLLTYACLTQKYADHRALLTWTLLPLLGYTFQPIWFFSGIERMRYITIFTVVAKLLGLSLMMLTVSGESTAAMAIIADGVGQVTGSVVAIVMMVKLGYRPRRPNWRYLRSTLKMTAGFFLSRIAATIYVSSGVILLGLFATPAIAGAYAIAERCYQAMQQVFAPLVQAIFPYMVKERAIRLLAKISVACVAAAAFIAIVSVWFAPLFLTLLIGPRTTLVMPILNIFLVCIVVHICTVMSGYPLAAVLGRTEVANRSVIFGSVVYIVCVTAAVGLNKVSGLAIASFMLLVECFIFTYRAVCLWPEAYRRLR